MLILDTTTRSLQIVLAAAPAANQLPFVASYVDMSQSAPALTAVNTNTGTTNSTTAVTLVAAPAASTSRQIKYLSIQNQDTTSSTVTVEYNDNGTLRVICTFLLAPNNTLVYSGDGGWKTLDSFGGIKEGSNVANMTPQFFSGNGSTTAFTLSPEPSSEYAAFVFLSGLQQRAGIDYTISGATITFTTAPPTGTSNISVIPMG